MLEGDETTKARYQFCTLGDCRILFHKHFPNQDEKQVSEFVSRFEPGRVSIAEMDQFLKCCETREIAIDFVKSFSRDELCFELEEIESLPLRVLIDEACLESPEFREAVDRFSCADEDAGTTAIGRECLWARLNQEEYFTWSDVQDLTDEDLKAIGLKGRRLRKLLIETIKRTTSRKQYPRILIKELVRSKGKYSKID